MIWWTIANPRPVPFLLPAEERLKDLLQVVRRDAGPRIGNGDLDGRRRTAPAKADADLPSRLHGFEGVEKDIDKNLGYLVAVHGNRRQARLIFLYHLHLAGRQIGGQKFQRLLGDILQGVRLPAGFFRSGKIKEFRDHPVQPIDLLDHDRGISLFLGLPVKRFTKYWANPLMELKGLRISCATPAASRPSDARRSLRCTFS